MIKRKNIRYPDKMPFVDDELSGSVVSSTECTGLVGEIPEDEDAAQSYRSIYNVPVEPYANKPQEQNVNKENDKNGIN